MKRKWHRRLTAMVLALMLTASGPAGAEGESPEVIAVEVMPEATEVSAPKPTEKPMSEQTEEPTPKPVETPAPDSTEKPAQIETEVPREDEESSPERTKEPPVESTGEPDIEMTEPPEAETTEEPSAENTEEPAVVETPVAETVVTQEPSASATAEPEKTKEPGQMPVAKVIMAVSPLEKTEIVLSEKTSYEQAIAMLPVDVKVLLADGTIERATVSWSCVEFSEEAKSYRFASELADGGYTLGEGVTLPSVIFRIELPTELQSGDFVCRILEDDSLTVVGYSGSGSSVVVPASIADRRVSRIAASTFAGNDRLREIEIGLGIVELESGAFENCIHLEKVVLPDSLEKVGGGIFDGCDALECLTLAVSEELVMTSQSGYDREIVEEKDGEIYRREISVSFDRAVTDFIVSGGAVWHVEGSMVIEKEHFARIASGGRLEIARTGEIVVFGELSCSGSAEAAGRIFACAGMVTGIDENVVREHSWSKGSCAICGERQMIALGIELLQDPFKKVFDGTNGIDLSAEDFRMAGVLDGDDVYIAAVNTDFNAKAVGDYRAMVEVVLGGESAGRYSVQPIEIGVIVEPRRVSIAPRSGQHKTYGSPDPALSASYSGVIAGDALAGSLAREKGESVGKYEILIGTLDELNKNYKIVLDEVYFEIRAKSIANSDISVSEIANQRYTGSAVEPEVVVKDGSRTLKPGTDYELDFSENTDAGKAKVVIRGIGNYAGSRQTSFRIIKVSAGTASGGLSSAEGDSGSRDKNQVSLDVLNDFGAGSEPYEDDAAMDVELDEKQAVSRLVIDAVDFGEVLFDEAGRAVMFVSSERLVEEDEQQCRILSIRAIEAIDENGMEMNGVYANVRMKLPMATIAGLRAEEYTHIELIVGEAEVRVPLNTLYAEFVTAEGTLCVDNYEVRLWPVQSDEEFARIQPMLDECSFVVQPVHFEILAVPVSESRQVAEGKDILNLLDGIQLLFTPREAPTYLEKTYVVHGMAVDMQSTGEPLRAQFIMDGNHVKSPLMPMMGGVYALAEE